MDSLHHVEGLWELERTQEQQRLAEKQRRNCDLYRGAIGVILNNGSADRGETLEKLEVEVEGKYWDGAINMQQKLMLLALMKAGS